MPVAAEYDLCSTLPSTEFLGLGTAKPILLQPPQICPVTFRNLFPPSKQNSTFTHVRTHGVSEKQFSYRVIETL